METDEAAAGELQAWSELLRHRVELLDPWVIIVGVIVVVFLWKALSVWGQRRGGE